MSRISSSSQTSITSSCHLDAIRAHDAHEPLREHRRERVGDDPRLDAEIDEPDDGLDGVGRVERREHEVPRERRLQRDARGLGVADLADEDDVGILPQDRAKPRGEREPVRARWSAPG